MRVVDGDGEFAEIDGALLETRDGDERGSGAGAVDEAVIGAEEEDAVLHDGAAHVDAEFVLVLGGPGGGEEAAGVEHGVAEDLVARAVEVVGTALEDEV